MDLSPAQLQRDIIIGNDSGEFFSDIEHFNNVIGLHKLKALLPCILGVLHKSIINEKQKKCKKKSMEEGKFVMNIGCCLQTFGCCPIDTAV